MTDQTTEQTAFLEKIVEQSGLKSANEAQAAAKVVFRLLRDIVPSSDIQALEQELQESQSAASVDIADLWGDPNVMVAFFSRVSPLQQLNIGFKTAMLRLEHEAALPEEAKPEQVAMVVFAATKAELSDERIEAVAQCLPGDGLRQMWQQS